MRRDSGIKSPTFLARRRMLTGSAGIALSFASLGILLPPIALAIGPVTGVRNVENKLGYSIDFVNVEAKSHNKNNYQIGNNTTQPVSNAWVPWADNEQQFNDHHIRVSNSTTNKTVCQIWQSGDYVRYSLGDKGWEARSKKNELIKIKGQSIDLKFEHKHGKINVSASYVGFLK